MTRKQNKNFCILLFVLVVLLPASGEAWAQYAQPEQWAVKMFSELGTERTHDFGSVALHAEVVHRFAFKNIYKEDVEISSAQSNCGCTKVTVSRKVIPSGETGEIIARVDTTGKEHTKRRRATITVVFDRPALAEVQLQIQTYIRSDVGFEPGTVDFGTISQGRNLTKKVYLQYEGTPGWALTSIRKTSNTIKAEAREVNREGGRVLYEINVSLVDDAPSGYLNGLLRFTTNEANSAATSIFLPIHGLIMEPLTAKPSCVQLGVVHLGEKITKNLVIRGAKPFRITQVSSPDSRIRFLVADDESPVHVIPFTFTAGAEASDINQIISIKTDQTELPDLEIEVTGYVREAAIRPTGQTKPDNEKSKAKAVSTTTQSEQKRSVSMPFVKTSTPSDAQLSSADKPLPGMPFASKDSANTSDRGDSQNKGLPVLLLKPTASTASTAGPARTKSDETVPVAAKPVLTLPGTDQPVLTSPETDKPVATKNNQPQADASGWSTVIGHKSGERVLR